MTETLTEKLTRTADGMRLYQQERAIQDLTELVCELMEEERVSRSQLAQRLGKSRGYVTQLLDGRANMTVRTMSDVFTALNRTIHFQDGPLQATATSVQVIDCRAGWLDRDLAWSDRQPVGSGRSARKLAV